MHIAKAAMFCAALSTLGFAQQSEEHRASINDPGNSLEVVSAKVEQVFTFADEGGYQFISYRVTYQGRPVIVEDPIGSTNIAVGGDLTFLVIRHDMTKSPKGGKRIISFIVGKQQA
jgi:hypothetical protein